MHSPDGLRRSTNKVCDIELTTGNYVYETLRKRAKPALGRRF